MLIAIMIPRPHQSCCPGLFPYFKKRFIPLANDEKQINCWSAGCASGEEAYTAKILWHHYVHPTHPSLDFKITATDADKHMLERARQACYSGASLKELPDELESRCFEFIEDQYRLTDEYRHNVSFINRISVKNSRKNHFTLSSAAILFSPISMKPCSRNCCKK